MYNVTRYNYKMYSDSYQTPRMDVRAVDALSPGLMKLAPHWVNQAIKHQAV